MGTEVVYIMGITEHTSRCTDMTVPVIVNLYPTTDIIPSYQAKPGTRAVWKAP